MDGLTKMDIKISKPVYDVFCEKELELGKLYNFFLYEWPEQKEQGSICDNAIRLLREYKNRLRYEEFLKNAQDLEYTLEPDETKW